MWALLGPPRGMDLTRSQASPSPGSLDAQELTSWSYLWATGEQGLWLLLQWGPSTPMGGSRPRSWNWPGQQGTDTLSAPRQTLVPRTCC